MTRVYHYTSTLALPWIVASGELQPSQSHTDDDADRCVWATTNPGGEATALPARPCNRNSTDEWLSKGQFLMVRLTLPSTGFKPFTLRQAKLWGWTEEECAGYGISKWRIRRGSLPLASVLRVDVRPCAGYAWTRIEATSEHCFEVSEGTMGFEIDGFHYYSTAVGGGYTVPDRDELAEMFEEKEENW